MDRSPVVTSAGVPDAKPVHEASPSSRTEATRSPVLKRARSSSEHTIGRGSPPEPRAAAAAAVAATADSPTEENSAVLHGRVDYPRRRAVIACEICRSRKSRCDGGRPKCSLCRELKAECVYREPGVKLDAGDKLILERLSHLEGLLQSNLLHSSAPSGTPNGPISPANSSTTASDDVHSKRLAAAIAASAASPLALSGIGTSAGTNISAMPKTHTTPALHLLQWPVIKDLVSRQCDPQILMQLELAREPITLTQRYALDLENNVATFARAFFEKANVWYAVVNPYAWHSYFRAASAQSFRHGPESCVVLLVLALGQAAHSGVNFARSSDRHPGMDYFASACYILPTLTIRNDVLSAQCHILAAAYMMYLVRPLEAWNLLCNASLKLQLLLSAPSSIPPSLKDLSDRIYWNTLMIESDLLAELDLPHSGIVQFEESMGLPRSFQYDAAVAVAGAGEPPGTDDLWYFLAEIALRRLLNRVSHLIYSYKRTSPTAAIAALEPVVAELDYQLTQWYEGLPPRVRFPRERLPAHNALQTVLRLRYFACRTIIFRPYVHAVLADEAVANEPGVRGACAKCLEACLRQLENLPAHHAGHLPYLWQGALSIVSQTLLLMGASLSDVLSSLMPPRQQVDGIIAEVVREVERLAPMAPSLSLCAEIVREAEEKRQTLMQKRKR